MPIQPAFFSLTVFSRNFSFNTLYPVVVVEDDDDVVELSVEEDELLELDASVG